MAKRAIIKNYRPFTAICDCQFGREVIVTNADTINESNIVDELYKALKIHEQNAIEINYLDRYYRGDQPIIYRNKKGNRTDVCNKIVNNFAYFIVETKTSEMVGEPIQYVQHGKDEKKSKEIERLNVLMDGEDKSYYDIELCRWRSICGTAYRFIGKDDKIGKLLDESPFSISTENPIYTFVCYFNNGKPAFSCQIRTNDKNERLYNVYTNSEWFLIKGKSIEAKETNGNGAIPVVEYPNNARRLGDIELTLTITDELNNIASNRGDGIEQFVSSYLKFVNCEVDENKLNFMREQGALVVRSNNGAENKADVDLLTQELNQGESQVYVDELYEKMLVIQGLANRQGNTGGDTAGAVQMRNGFYSQEKRSELYEPIFKMSERMTLRLVLNRLRIDEGFSLLPSDVEIKISRSKTDNMLTKAEVLKILLDCGINYERAIKTVNLFADPEQVAIESRDRMQKIFSELDASKAEKESKSEENTENEENLINADNEDRRTERNSKQ